MKPLWVVLIALAAALVGFFAGGGLGFFGGTVAGTIAGAGMGSCAAVRVAVDERLLTKAQADHLAAAIGKKLHDTNPDLSIEELKVHESKPEADNPCGDFLAKVKDGFVAAK
jgi:hypothetical protein